MRIPLDRRSPAPVYRQIHDHISRLIQSGMLKPGDRLPSIRAMAENAQVNKLTVIEAYGVLEADGLIYARAGAGYFVSSAPAAPVTTDSQFAPHQEVILPSADEPTFYNSYLNTIQAKYQGDYILFNSGFSQCQVGAEELQRIARRALRQEGMDLFSYDLPQGQGTLRRQIAQLLIQRGLEVSPEDLIVTNGSMQGLSLVMQHLLQPGDWVIVESPTYPGALAQLQQVGARVIGIPMTREGINLELLEQYLHSHRPRLIYTISTLHNPTGITTSQSHRRSLLTLASQYQCTILEDNAYEGLSFSTSHPPIKALDVEDRVIYVGTFAKTLVPGLRIGYLVATGLHYQPLLEHKLLNDLGSSTTSQAIVSEYLSSGYYRRHLTALRTAHLTGHQAMLRSLQQHFPAAASWTVPAGGMFLWVKLPEGLPLPAICAEAIAHKILINPGSLFFPNQQGYPALRLNFAQPIENIERGIAILGQLMR